MIVRVKVPFPDFLDVVTVNTDVEVAGFGLNEDVLLEGAPVTLSDTFPLNPPVGVIVTV